MIGEDDNGDGGEYGEQPVEMPHASTAREFLDRRLYQLLDVGPDGGPPGRVVAGRARGPDPAGYRAAVAPQLLAGQPLLQAKLAELERMHSNGGGTAEWAPSPGAAVDLSYLQLRSVAATNGSARWVEPAERVNLLRRVFGGADSSQPGMKRKRPADEVGRDGGAAETGQRGDSGCSLLTVAKFLVQAAPERFYHLRPAIAQLAATALPPTGGPGSGLSPGEVVDLSSPDTFRAPENNSLAQAMAAVLGQKAADGGGFATLSEDTVRPRAAAAPTAVQLGHLGMKTAGGGGVALSSAAGVAAGCPGCRAANTSGSSSGRRGSAHMCCEACRGQHKAHSGNTCNLQNAGSNRWSSGKHSPFERSDSSPTDGGSVEAAAAAGADLALDAAAEDLAAEGVDLAAAAAHSIGRQQQNSRTVKLTPPPATTVAADAAAAEGRLASAPLMAGGVAGGVAGNGQQREDLDDLEVDSEPEEAAAAAAAEEEDDDDDDFL